MSELDTPLTVPISICITGDKQNGQKLFSATTVLNRLVPTAFVDLLLEFFFCIFSPVFSLVKLAEQLV